MLTVKQEILDHLEKMGLDEQRLLLEFIKTMKETQYTSYSASRLVKLSVEERSRFIAQGFELIAKGDFEAFDTERCHAGFKQIHEKGNVVYHRLYDQIRKLTSNDQTFVDNRAKVFCQHLYASAARLQAVFGILLGLESELGLPKLMMFLRFEWQSPLINIRESVNFFSKMPLAR